MGSKKHKKESKKRKHHSRSRSPTDGEERERKRHRKHKDRKKDRSPDVEEVPVDSHLLPQNGSRASRSRSSSSDPPQHSSSHIQLDQQMSRDKKGYTDKIDSPVTSSSGAQESLSIEETNRLRAKLGLKPLEVTEKPAADDGKIVDDLGEFYHRPATNIAEQKKTEKIREKLEERKEKRKLESKLKTTLLADGSDDEDTLAWINKSRKMEKEREEAAKRAALLDEMDDVFGVGALVEEERLERRHGSYSADHLKGLRVAHDLNALAEERETVLTLADREVLAEDAEDVLVNVNIVDDERYKKNIIEKKKAKAGYQAYEDEADIEAAALGFQKPVLAKYDEEIDPKVADKKKGFRIGDEDGIEAQRFKEMMRQELLRGSSSGKRLESLQLPPMRLAPEYLDHDEIQAKFKKPKKKGKIRKRPKDEPIDVDDHEAGTAPLDTDDTDVKPELLKSEVGVEEDEVEPDGELQAALERARRLQQAREINSKVLKVEEILSRVKEEAAEEGESAIVLDATAEFCRTLGDAAPGKQQAARKEMEYDDIEEGGGEGGSSAWNRVDVGSEKAPDLVAGGSVGLEAEPAVGAGVAGALRLAFSKGYLQKGQPAPSRAAPRHHPLAAQNYSIEDKAHAEDDKYARRERGHGGPGLEFREKAHFKPHIKLDYVDDEGRPLCPKEAFRYLSHKFHGKGPGKNKQEKRLKKSQQEGLMKKMSSTDTPLGTLQMLQDKQRETHSPYVVLSGARRDQPR